MKTKEFMIKDRSGNVYEVIDFNKQQGTATIICVKSNSIGVDVGMRFLYDIMPGIDTEGDAKNADQLIAIQQAKTILKNAGILLEETIERGFGDYRSDEEKSATAYKELSLNGKITIKWTIQI